MSELLRGDKNERKVAERIFERLHGRLDDCPYGMRPALDRLWPSDQERYLEMARAAMDAFDGELDG